MHRIKNKIEIKGKVSAVPVDMMMTFNLLFRSISLFLSTYVYRRKSDTARDFSAWAFRLLALTYTDYSSI